jgi:hypothetical protein
VAFARLYAFAVASQKNVDEPVPAQGGAIGRAGALGTVISQTTTQVRAGQWTDVRLNVDARSRDRSSEVRDAVRSLAFGSKPDADDAATGLANRLSGVMDHRSPDCLLVIAVEAVDGGRSVTMWTFPRDEALRFSAGRGGPSVEVLRDAFSRRSHLRKAAALVGADDGRTSFLKAKAVDLVTGGGQLAEYWISDFLDASLDLHPDSGSGALGRALRSAWDAAKTDQEREQFHDAAIAVRRSTRARWSLQEFADEYLTGEAKKRFLGAREARELGARQFRFSRDAFDRVIHFRVLRTDNGLRISAPFADADSLLDFDETADGTRVTASGMVREDKVSQRA